MAGRGKTVLLGGQIGWDAEGRFAEGFIGQVEQALRNILAVLAEAGGGPEHIGRMTWYVTDMAEYRDSLRALGPAYRAVMGRHFPAMTLVQVVALVEPEARVEIEATAIMPD
jgi:enamine deaminase RidA (YjgF/YER057c/UK114 family)